MHPPFSYQFVQADLPDGDHYRIANWADDRVATCYAAGNARRVTELLNKGVTAENLVTFHREQAAWSQATFGSDYERGPRGPLGHLAKEVQETLEVLDQIEAEAAVERPDPHLQVELRAKFRMEAVDCLFLLFDFSRRAGITIEDLTKAAFEKLDINNARKWNPPSPDAPVEHVRG